MNPIIGKYYKYFTNDNIFIIKFLTLTHDRMRDEMVCKFKLCATTYTHLQDMKFITFYDTGTFIPLTKQQLEEELVLHFI